MASSITVKSALPRRSLPTSLVIEFNVALNNPAHWCDVLILHLNVKYCHATNNKIGTVLSVNLARKYYRPLEDAYWVEFNYRGIASTPDYFAVG